MKYLVFLDIDGVFTSLRAQLSSLNCGEMWSTFDPVAINFMNWIHDRYPVEFVLISTWKQGLGNPESPAIAGHWVLSAFRNAGFDGTFHYRMWTDDYRSVGKTRAHEIQEFLQLYGKDVDDFIIFDDNDYEFKQILGKKRLIRTDAHDGMLSKHMLDARSMMGTWVTKKEL